MTEKLVKGGDGIGVSQTGYFNSDPFISEQEILTIIKAAFNDLANKSISMPPIMRIDVPDNNGEVDIQSA